MTSTARPLLIQVVPRMTPVRCGVSDGAIMLAEELESSFGIGTAYVVLNSNERCAVPYPAVYCAPQQLLESCLSLAGGGPGSLLGSLLVHVSGYGYAANGVPQALADALAAVKTDGRFRVACIFHELFATAMPWRSAFWHSRRQQKALRKIAGQCDLQVTNTRLHANWLLEQSPRQNLKPVRILSAFSQAGMAQRPAPFSARKDAIAVFGLPGTRQRAYGELISMGTTLRVLGIEEIWDIGPAMNAPAEVDGIPVKQIGPLDVADLSAFFSRLKFGYVSYPPLYLGKSGVLAAYCAHGTIPLIPKPFAGEVDGLLDGVHVFSPETAKRALASGMESCSIAAWNWHFGHRLHAHAELYGRWVMQAAEENGAVASPSVAGTAIG